jgi:hypothetical protein
MPGSRRWLVSAAFITIALGSAALVAGPAMAAVPGTANRIPPPTPPADLTGQELEETIQLAHEWGRSSSSRARAGP